MKAAGWILTCLGFALAFVWNFLAQDNVGLMAVSALLIFAGMLLLAVNATMRMSRGELRLRPIEAVKRWPIIFLVMVGVYALAHVIFPEMEIRWTETLIKCSIASLAMALYFSAYRKLA
ncbi:hypothetical protein [Erythrobacter neustonensis]|uniref:hypothetical protein n=1 Tax=Erythrobacter neustonensis TaxID=1112 RepID=UPI000A7296B3|nr:hypothetical protein [Erythrobacter neustonensis]